MKSIWHRNKVLSEHILHFNSVFHPRSSKLWSNTPVSLSLSLFPILNMENRSIARLNNLPIGEKEPVTELKIKSTLSTLYVCPNFSSLTTNKFNIVFQRKIFSPPLYFPGQAWDLRMGCCLAMSLLSHNCYAVLHTSRYPLSRVLYSWMFSVIQIESWIQAFTGGSKMILKG